MKFFKDNLNKLENKDLKSFYEESIISDEEKLKKIKFLHYQLIKLKNIVNIISDGETRALIFSGIYDIIKEIKIEIEIKKIITDIIEKFGGKTIESNLPVPILEPVMLKLSNKLSNNFNNGNEYKYKVVSAYSEMGESEREVSDILKKVSMKFSNIEIVEEFDMDKKQARGIKGSLKTRLPYAIKLTDKFISKVKNSSRKVELFIVNGGGSNCKGGTHVVYISNNLGLLKKALSIVTKKIYKIAPGATALEHPISLIRSSQMKYESNSSSFNINEIYTYILEKIDPNRIMTSTAIDNIRRKK